MKRLIQATTLALAGTLVLGVQAQDERPEVQGYVYATYHHCTMVGQEKADEIFEKYNAPAYDKLLADGKITAYGWLSHHTGGHWRRVGYFTAATLPGALDAQAAFFEASQAADPDGTANKAFGEACPSHDDYIWAQRGIGSGNEERGEAGFSVYFICNENGEERADDIVRTHFAPTYDRFVSEKKLASWGWSEHWVGGKYRRLLTMTAGDHKTLLAARDEAIGAIFQADDMEAIGKEFTDICGSHSDYMWDITHEKP